MTHSSPAPASPRRWSANLLVAGVLVALSGGAWPRLADGLTGFYFAPTQEQAAQPEAAGYACERFWLVTEGGERLEAWWLPARGRSASGVVVHAHGNGANLTRQWPLSVGLCDRGFDVLAFDYRGFGRSDGSASRRRAVADLGLALSEGKRRADAAGGLPLALLGQSMGAALAFETLDAVGERSGVSALVVDGPFSSWPDIGALHLAGDGWRGTVAAVALRVALLRAGTEPITAARGLRGLPVLVIAGQADEVCPPEMARRLAVACAGTLLELPGSGHVGSRGAAVDAEVLGATAAFLAQRMGGLETHGR